MYSFRKQKYINGPKLPNDFDYKHGCVTAVNRTFAMVITARFIQGDIPIPCPFDCALSDLNFDDYQATTVQSDQCHLFSRHLETQSRRKVLPFNICVF